MKNDSTILKQRLQLIHKYFDIDKIIKPTQGKKEIQSYYRKSHFAYISVVSKDGFMHMGLSYDGKFKKEDLFGQADLVNTYLKKQRAKRVLELGAGNGSNSAYLAKKNPSLLFYGLDLSKEVLSKFHDIKNYQHISGDYHDLNAFEDDSFDLIFAIETICHSVDKKMVLMQVYKKLKHNGCFIIFDGYTERPVTKLTRDELLGKKLLEKSMAVENFEQITSFRRTIKTSRLTLEKEEDLTDAVLPSMKRLDRIAFAILRFPAVAKLVFRVLPFDMVKNIVAGLLLVLYCEKPSITSYYLHILRKK